MLLAVAVIVVSVLLADVLYGFYAVHIRADASPLNERVNRIVALVLSASLILVFLLPLVSRRLQQWLIRPILEMSGAAGTVAREQNYSVRIGKRSDDELGRLADAFNAMLETLEMQTRRQMQDHRLLEAQIAERTAALEQAQASLLRQERLATLGKLTGTVSHELRNPLGTIQTSIDVLRDNLTECTPAVDRALSRMERNIHRCENIINELLDFSRGSPPHLQRVQTDVWLHEVLAGYPRPLCVECERIDAVSAEFDPERLRRAMLNVLDNAWQACSERQIPAADAPCVRISLRAEAARLEIVIAD
ncbi:MAG TPA: histidine kinase dimerization/phospho-acceptor domain-containing protein, partial [Gammaproteobacteria bacterium]